MQWSLYTQAFYGRSLKIHCFVKYPTKILNWPFWPFLIILNTCNIWNFQRNFVASSRNSPFLRIHGSTRTNTIFSPEIERCVPLHQFVEYPIATLIKIGIYRPRGWRDRDAVSRSSRAGFSAKRDSPAKLAARKHTLPQIGRPVSFRGRPSRVPCGKLMVHVVEIESLRVESV